MPSTLIKAPEEDSGALSEDAVSPVSTRQARRQTQGSRAWNHDGWPITPPALSVSGLVMSPAIAVHKVAAQ